MTSEDVYALADKAAELLRKKTVRRFNDCKKKMLIQDFDELFVIRSIDTLYDNIQKDAISIFTDLASMVYADSLAKKEAEEDEDFWEDWLLSEVLNVPDEITKYTYTNEIERKKERAKESINASTGDAKTYEFNKALRYIDLQNTQYADNVTDKARMKAFKDSGVEKVVWHTQEDEKVCDDCEPLNGQVFDIDKAPPKQHYRCRCYYTPWHSPLLKPRDSRFVHHRL